MAKSRLNPNQTQFMGQEPVLESAVSAEMDPVQVEGEIPKDSQKNKTKLIILGVVGFLMLVVFLLMLILLKMKMDSGPSVDQNGDEILVDEQGQELSPQLQEVLELSEELEVADPSLDSVSFPPIDMELRLEKADK